MSSVLEACRDLPLARFAPGEVLLAEGDRSGRLFILAEGAVEVLKGEFQVNYVTEPGALFGEMSVLLDMPHMATVRAATPCAAYVSDDAAGFLHEHRDIAFGLARMLAQRLHGVTTYLADLKRQFEGEQSHLGMVDTILECLTHEQRRDVQLGSDRDPGY